MASANVNIGFSLVPGPGRKVRLKLWTVTPVRGGREDEPIPVLDGEPYVGHSRTRTQKAHRRRLAKAVQRLLLNLEHDLDECTCAPKDPCAAHQLAEALRG